MEATETQSVDGEIEALFEREGPRLWHTILAMSGGRRDIADDAVAEAFARALEHRSSVRRLEPWLYRVAINVARGELKRGNRLSSLDGVEPAAAVTEPGIHLESLRALSPGQRAALYLHDQEDLSIRDVAKLMGTSAAVVKVHLSRGRKRLRDVIGDEHHD